METFDDERYELALARTQAVGAGCALTVDGRSAPGYRLQSPGVIRVALADDQALVRAGFRLILETAGLAILGEAATGRQALELVRAERPDVILMDIRMPDFDGLEATRRITTARLPTRVLVLTTFDLDQYVLAGSP